MGFYRSIIKGTPHSMSGGYYYSSWQTAIEEGAAYLTKIKFVNNITRLNMLNTIANKYNFTAPTHPENPVYGTSSNGTEPLNTVTGINISNYDKLYLNSDCSNMFYNCKKCTNWSGLSLFNWTYVTNCSYMFFNCDNFNQPVIIGNNVENCSRMFSSCDNFNQSITIGQNVTDCGYMFSFCDNFNQPVIIGQKVTNCKNMFSSCNNFNQSITIGQNVTDCGYMFNGCSNFNQPVTIGQKVINCSRMFMSCHNFNQSITIGQNVTDCGYMFMNCIRLKKPIVIPESVNNCFNMFAFHNGPTNNSWGTINNIVPVPNVYFKGISFRNINVKGMFARMAQINAVTLYNNTRGIRVNVHYNVAIENQLLINNGASLTGATITWTPMTNGYYNALANIYLYNNYEG